MGYNLVPEAVARMMFFIVFQSFIGKRHSLRKMLRLAGLGFRIVGRETR